MKGAFSWNDRYAGDEAWREWFEVCSVALCGDGHAAALRAQIEAAMYARLAKCGVPKDDMGGEDPVAFFDSFFKLKGSRESPKPLKSYFAYRIAAEGLRMRDFACGTLFGAVSGRVRDIVIDWISVAKGWKRRSVCGEDGRRRQEWETSATAPDASTGPVDTSDPAALLDVEPMRREAAAALEAVGTKTRTEKPVVAFLLYLTAHDVPLVEPAVLEVLDMGKSRAYQLRDKVVKEAERELRRREGADDPLFARVMLETCEEVFDGRMAGLFGGGR